MVENLSSSLQNTPTQIKAENSKKLHEDSSDEDENEHEQWKLKKKMYRKRR